MTKISIAQAKQIRELLGMQQVIIFGIRNGAMHVATHGEKEEDARQAARIGNILKEQIGFPPEACKAKPLPRTCGNCVFYKPDCGTHCFNGWSGDGSEGQCLVEPRAEKRLREDHACQHFDPKE